MMARNEIEKGIETISRQLTASSKGGVSWPIIIILFVVFWPAGVFFLYRKLTVDRVAQLNDGKSLRIGGIALIIIGAIMLSNENYVAIFHVAGGIALLMVGNNMKKTSIRYRQYINLVANEQIRDIDVIAGVVSVKYETCVSDLQKMIDHNFFQNAFIDHGARRIILQEQAVLQPAYATHVQSLAGPRVVQCKSCGANNMVLGQVSACEYCGSPLS